MPTLRRIFSNSGWYEGDWIGKKTKQGFGVMSTKSGKLFEGDWVAGKPHGLGTLSVTDPSSGVFNRVYQGEWKNGKREGTGTSYGSKGQRYDGTWLNGKKSGPRGELRFSNGDVYVGGFKEGERHGPGKMLFAATGDFYDGNWLHDKQEGHGKFFYAKTASTLEGVWHDGVCKSGIFKSSAQLPELGLEAPDEVLKEAEARMH